MMTRRCDSFVLMLLMAVALMAGCGKGSLLPQLGEDGRGLPQALLLADSLMNSRPDSALAVLEGAEGDMAGEPKSVRMRYQLLRHQAMNKADVPFTSDSLMLDVTDYYDRHGTANDRMLAHYLLGCVYRDRSHGDGSYDHMYDHQIQEDFFYMMLYGAVAMMSTMASCYLLFRRANAIAPDVTSSVRLRRWTAAFFACMTLSHLWYLPVAFHTSSVEILQSYLVGAMLDFMTLIPCAIVLLLVLLQDRRRPLWPVGVMVAPVIIGLAVSLVYNYFDIMPQFYGYHLLLAIGLIIYMVRATRQYGHWLRDNYADLENKEVWQSLAVLAIILLVFGIYAFGIKNMIYKYITQVNNIILICYLLWRVETLSDLSISVHDAEEPVTSENVEDHAQSSTVRNNIGPLLKQYCEEPQLYLQYDISATQLAKLVGTNRVYLSKYFAAQGTTYNAYINSLRIQHFIQLYHEAVATSQPVIAKQLAYQSGFRSYSTFSAVFKQVMGTTVTAWMHSTTE